ncbi:MAG: GNAT family N-acetyltransferase [Pseudomonadota bacterium]
MTQTSASEPGQTVPEAPVVRHGGGELRLEEITAANLAATLALDVFPAQRDFVAPTAKSLAECYVYRSDIPRLAMLDDQPVGFVLVHRGEVEGEDGRRFRLERLLIDAAHQRRGIGRALLGLVIDWARRFSPVPDSIALGVVQENAAAIALYESTGFQATGEIRYGEAVMERPLNDAMPADRAGTA